MIHPSNMKGKSALLISIILMICLSVASVGAQDAEVMVEPSSVTLGPDPDPIGTEFTVNITVYDVTDLYGYELKVFWDNTILSATGEAIHLPPDSGWDAPNNFQLGPGIEQDYNATHGRYHRGLSAMPIQTPHPTPFTGTTTLITLTFEVLAEGETSLDLQDTKFSNFDVDPITHSSSDGSITVIPEFSLILPLFLFATLAVIILRKKSRTDSKN